jgi:hypothetical protein
MSNILAGLESISTDASFVDETSIDELIVETVEIEREVIAAEEAFAQGCDVVEQAAADCDMLENIKNVIEENGICRPMMKVVDPNEALASAGIIPPYSDLEDSPVKDAHAVAATESISDTLKKGWDKIVAFLKEIWKRLKLLFSKLTGLFKKQDAVVKALIKKLDDVVIDSEKAKKVKVSVLKDVQAKVIADASKSIGKFIDQMIANGADTDVIKGKKALLDKPDYLKSVKGVFKVETEKKTDDGVTYYSYDITYVLETESVTFDKVGLSDAQKALKDSLSILATMENLDFYLEATEKVAKNADKVARIKTDDKDKIKMLNKEMKLYKEVSSKINKCAALITKMSKTAVSVAISQGRGAVSASK